MPVAGLCGDAASDPYAAFAVLREQERAVRLETGEWVLSRYSDVVSALTDRRFAHWRIPGAQSPFAIRMNRWMSLFDPKAGVSMRLALSSLTDEARLGETAARAVAAASCRIDDMGRFDVIADVARPVTLAVAAALLGVQAEEEAEFSSLAGQSQPLFTIVAATPGEVTPSAKLARWFVDLARRGSAPYGDVSDDDAIAFSTFLLFAAHDNMMNFIGNAWLALMRNPGAMARLRREPHLWPMAIEELLRYDSPVQFISLLCEEPVETAGVRIQPGEIVWACIAAANRDSRRFASPDELILDRRDPSHLSFGIGAMKCVGAPLARIEGQLVLAFLSRLRNPRTVGEIPFRREPRVLRGAERIVIEHDGLRAQHEADA